MRPKIYRVSFQKTQRLNNYKPFLIDDFQEYLDCELIHEILLKLEFFLYSSGDTLFCIYVLILNKFNELFFMKSNKYT